MQFRQFKMGSARPSAGIGCGGILAVLGLVLVSPVGDGEVREGRVFALGERELPVAAVRARVRPAGASQPPSSSGGIGTFSRE